MAGVDDCYTSATGQTATLGNFGNLFFNLSVVYLNCANLAKATFKAITKTYTYLTPDLWQETPFEKPPAQEFTDFLARTEKK